MGFKRHWLGGSFWLLTGGLAAGEPGVGFQVGVFAPGAGVRDEMYVDKTGVEVVLALSQVLDGRHEFRAEGAYGACWDRAAGRAHAPWERHVAGHRPVRASMDRLYLGLGLRRYLAEGHLRPFVSAGFGASRFASRAERFLPRDLASCHRRNHHHPEVRPWSEAIRGREPRSLGPQPECGFTESCPLRTTGWKLGVRLGAGCLVGDRVEVVLRHDLTPVSGRTLGAWTLSAGFRF